MRRNAMFAAGCAVGLCMGAASLFAQRSSPSTGPATQSGETNARPLVFMDHAIVPRPAADLPVLSAGVWPRFPGLPKPQDQMDPAWNTFEQGTTGRLARLLDGGANLDAITEPAVVELTIAAPEKAPWMIAGIAREGKSITVRLKSWDPADAAGLTAGRRASLLWLGRMAPGDYDLAINCDHYQENAEGLYQFSGKQEFAKTTLHIGPDGIAAPATITPTDLKTRQVDARASATEVPPLHWARHVSGKPHAFDVQVGTLDVPAALADFPKRHNMFIEPAPAAAAKSTDLVACIISPTLMTDQYMALQNISMPGKDQGWVIHVALWRDNGARLRNAPSTTELLVPLSFLAKGKQTLTVRWHEYHAPNTSEPYVPVDAPTPDALVKVSVE